MQSVLWIGLAASEEVYLKLVEKGYIHFAAQVAQLNFITGIEEVLKGPVDMISGFMMPVYPYIDDLITKPHYWISSFGGEGRSVKNLNIKYIDVIYRTHQMKVACTDWAQKHSADEVIVFVYSAVNAYIKAALEVKKICKKAKVYLIVTDLPQFMELRPTKTKKILKNLDWNSLNKSIHYCDGWILFTKHMITYLDLPEEKCIVVEGSVNTKNIREIEPVGKTSGIVIMYSGSLGLQYGIPELLEAFSGIKNDAYELWFTGKGNAERLIDEKASMDPRIKNFGFLPSHEDLLVLQSKATMLISTRMPTEMASAYCFPSKIFDYMLSGKPVLSFYIQGIPDEYYQHLILIESTTPSDIRKAIMKVGAMSTEQRKQIGIAAKNFIVEKKNNIFQAERICAFVGMKKGKEI